MLRLYRDSTHPLADASLKEFPREVIWIDLVRPTDDEKNLVEKRTGVNIPSVEALSEIESSSRLARQEIARRFRTGGLLQQESRGSELGRQVAVDFKSDADFHERGSRPVHSCLPTLSGRSELTWRN